MPLYKYSLTSLFTFFYLRLYSNQLDQSPPRYTNSPTIPVFNQDGCVDFNLDLHLDRHPADTSWKIIERTHGTVAEGSNYRDGYGTIEFRECLSIYGCYVFELYDTFKDGCKCAARKVTSPLV